MIKIYTDGSCPNNGRKDSKGGWAYLVIDDDNGTILAKRSGARYSTTNNQMELEAVKQALIFVNNFLIDKENLECCIYTDSAYIANCVKEKWYEKWEKNNWKNSKKQTVKNKDYWQFLIPWFRNEHIKFEKVVGHSDDDLNNAVDEMARKCAASL